MTIKNLITAVLFTLTTGACAPSGSYELPGGGGDTSDEVVNTETESEVETDTETDTETDPDTNTPEPTDDQHCWNSYGAYSGGQGGMTINWDLAETSQVASFPEDGFNYHDAESVIVVNPAEGEVHQVTLTDPGNNEHELFLYTQMPPYEKQQMGYSEDCDNCKVTALQPDGTVVEINYYSVHNWVLPSHVDERPDVCATEVYEPWGADAGAHAFTRIGMFDAALRGVYERVKNGDTLTETDYYLGHVLHVAFDTSILGCYAGATNDHDCHTSIVNTADSGAVDSYRGTLPLGFPLGVRPSSFNCLDLASHFGRAICATLKVHPLLPTEESNKAATYGEAAPEMQWMLANGLAAVIQEHEGEVPFNNTGSIAADLDRLFSPTGPVVAIDNWETSVEGL